MATIINPHEHLLTITIQPPELTFQGLGIPKTLILALLEAIEYGEPVVKLIEKMSKYFRHGNKLHIIEFLNAYSTNLRESTDILLKSMKKAGISYATPLMLDLAEAYHTEYTMVPYEQQLDWFSKLPIYSNGKLFPFIMFDPRRKNVMEITAKYLEEGGFLGVKMYPPLGYNPNPKDTKTNTPEMNRNLKDLYAYCEKHQIPITAHCSRGGIVGDNISAAQAKELTHPKNWYGVLWDYSIRLNLAHFGGNSDFVDTFADNRKNTWASIIRTYLTEFCEDGSFVYTDIAFHQDAVINGNRDRYYKAFTKAIDDPFVVSSMLYGDDWPLSVIDYSQKSFINSIKEHAGEHIIDVIGNLNVTDFLMNDKGQLPDRIVKYLVKNNIFVPVF